MQVEKLMDYPSMEIHVESQKAQKLSLSRSNSSSSFSSSLSSSSSSSYIINFPLLFSPIHPGNGDRFDSGLAGQQHQRFIDVPGNGGLEWKAVEERFDRLALVGIRPEPAVKWSDFGFCIGMQQSLDFANELLRALRRRRAWKYDITKNELHELWCRLTNPCIDARIQVLFDMCDRNMDGRITEMDIKQTIILNARTNKLNITHEEAEDYAALVFDVLDEENRGYIKLPQFEALFKVSSSKAKTSTSTNRLSIINNFDQTDQFHEPISKAEVWFRSQWRRAWIVGLWLIICFALFTWKFIQYHNRTAFEVMGYCVSTAKGAAETLKFNMALILLPVCRNSITWLRRNRRINSVIPFNDNINFHKLVAGGIVVGVILHGGAHLACDFPRISSCDGSIFRRTIAARFQFHQPSYIEILTTTEVATGIIMVILMAIAFLLATTWPRRRSPLLPRSIRQVTGYNAFWYSHHLFIFVYALLIVHSVFLFLTDKWAEKTTWMYIAVPVLLYTGERIFRAVRSGLYEVKVLKASIYPGKVLFLKFSKPEGFKYQSGMYIFIQCPQLSPFEWHPFSLTSGPDDEYLSLHIRTLGDWSYDMYTLFQEGMLSGVKNYPKIYIDGPYGAASQDHVKYDIVVLIGLGIGATPFISVLKDVISRSKPGSDQTDCGDCSSRNVPLKTYLYWVTREQSSFDWFKDVIKELSRSDQNQSAVEMHNFLTSVHQEGDARSTFISVIQALHHAKKGIDIVSRTPVRTHFARPNWFSIFSKLAGRHRGGRIGVFYCGPSALAREIERLCTKFSTKTSTRFVFHKENY